MAPDGVVATFQPGATVPFAGATPPFEAEVRLFSAADFRLLELREKALDAFAALVDGVQMDVEMPGGLMGGLKRVALAGESLFLVNYTARGSGAVGICGPFPGSIREHELDGEIICEKHAYLGHHGDVEIETAFARIVDRRHHVASVHHPYDGRRSRPGSGRR